MQVRVLPTALLSHWMSFITKLDPRHWRVVQRFIDSVRHQFFTIEGTDPSIRVDADLETVRRALGREHFTNAWELSYRYEGEDLNMRRPDWVPDQYEWYQTHVRGFERSDGVYLTVHLELEPTEYPYEHIRSVNWSLVDGQDNLIEVLDRTDLDYEVLVERKG